MNKEEAIEHIRAALAEVLAKNVGQLDEKTNLVTDGIVDSLDLMNFLLQLETSVGKKLKAIDESFSDFRVGTLADLIVREVG